MITLTQQPSTVSFAADPIIYRMATDLHGVTFPRIRADVTLAAHNYSSPQHIALSVRSTLVYSVDSQGEAVFNVSDLVNSVVNELERQQVAQSGTLTQEHYTYTLDATFTELGMTDGVDVDHERTDADTVWCIKGGTPQLWRLVAPHTDTAQFLTDQRALSRKPLHDGGGEWYAQNCPILRPLYQRGNAILGGEEHPTHTTTTIDATTAAENQPLRRAVTPQMRSFIFQNSYGLLESVTAFTLDALAYEGSHTTYQQGVEITLRPVTNQLSMSSTPQAVYTMGSGYVSRAWAEWWHTEFAVTPRAWMLFPEVDRWLPVAIEPDSKVTLYDRAKGDLCAVKFSVRPCFKGSVLAATL